MFALVRVSRVLVSMVSLAILLGNQSGALYSAAGDSCAYAWDLETMKVTSTFKGHEAFLHAVVALGHSQQLATASEDGTVRIWDVRTNETVRTIVPDRDARSPSFVGALAVDSSENWLVCGGGAGVLTAVHVLSGTTTSTVSTGCPIQCLTFGGDEVLAGGADGHVYRWSHVRDKLLGRIAVTPSSVYSVAASPSALDETILVAGTSRFVDVNIERSSRAFALSTI